MEGISGAVEALSDRVRRAVGAVRGAGAEVVIATGRSVLGTLEIASLLGFVDGWLVCGNGTMTVALDPSEPGGFAVDHVVTFDPAPALRLLRDLLPSAVYAVEDLARGFLVTAPFPDDELAGEYRVVDFEELISQPCTRVVVRDLQSEPTAFAEAVERSGLQGVTYNVGWTSWLDITPDGVNKATALERLRVRLGIDLADTVAVGDGSNDVDMLRWAGRGIAMGQADDAVKAAADEVTAPVWEDGAALVLEALLPVPSGREGRAP
jgi:hydroxymethylpyrimidine pyrophosphatase-like HAD family hydrolase